MKLLEAPQTRTGHPPLLSKTRAYGTGQPHKHNEASLKSQRA